jgi:hypothetical protein
MILCNQEAVVEMMTMKIMMKRRINNLNMTFQNLLLITIEEAKVCIIQDKLAGQLPIYKRKRKASKVKSKMHSETSFEKFIFSHKLYW